MLRRWVLTVFTEMYISPAISTVLSIPARCWSTSRSRSLSGSITGGAGGPSGPPAEARPAAWLTMLGSSSSR